MFRLDTSHPLGAHGWAVAPTTPELLLTCDPLTRHATLRAQGGTGEVLKTWSDPLEALAFLPAHLAEEGDSAARWVGFLNYDLGRLFESLPDRAADDLRLPLFAFGLCRPGVAPSPSPDVGTSSAPPTADFSPAAFESAVARALEYIRAGDVFQVNLAQRLTRALRAAPAEVYARLRQHTPAWYGGLLEFPADAHNPAFAIASNSPELFLRVDADRTVTTRPIKGTRPRSPGLDIDLLHSAKDKAELAMIVDLHRNDLGRVCQTGSVVVTEPRVIETHPTVFHGVATVQGRLRPEVGFVDILRATFPPGSVTGCPKIRSMQIIDELEPHRRGVYCGAVGYLGHGGTLQFNVAIRTMTLRRGLAHLPVGGGVVADSTPEGEYAETLVKATAMLNAVEG